jgi:hypothetical protein
MRASLLRNPKPLFSVTERLSVAQQRGYLLRNREALICATVESASVLLLRETDSQNANGGFLYLSPNVPTGYFLFEMPMTGPINYGVRKSFFLNKQACKQRYEMVKDLIAADPRDTKVMDSILGCFSK